MIVVSDLSTDSSKEKRNLLNLKLDFVATESSNAVQHLPTYLGSLIPALNATSVGIQYSSNQNEPT